MLKKSGRPKKFAWGYATGAQHGTTISGTAVVPLDG